MWQVRTDRTPTYADVARAFGYPVDTDDDQTETSTEEGGEHGSDHGAR